MLYCLEIFFVSLLNAGICSICPPVEDGESYTMSGTFIHNLTPKFETAFVKNKTPISKCLSNLTCFDNNKRTTTTLKSLSNNKYQFSLTIHSVTRNDENFWHFKYLGQASLRHNDPLFSCSLHIFAKGKNLTCEERIINNILKVRCIIINVYPAAKGLLMVNFLESTTTETSMNCTHEVVSKDIMYFASVCEGNVSMTLALLDSRDLIVSIYPNITGENDDKRFGLNITLDKYKNHSSLALENCPKVVTEGTEVSCLCRSKETTLTKNNISWYDANGKIVNNGDQTLSVIVTLKNTEHTCRRNDMAVEKNKIYYKPIVITKADNISCTSKTENQHFLAECNVSRIYPQGICLFKLNGQKIVNEIGDDYSSSENTKYPHNLYYYTKCTLKVTNGIMTKEMNIITVNVYPNITGMNSDEIYGVSKSIPFNLSAVSYSNPLNDVEHQSTFTEQLAPIVLIAAVILFIVIMSSLIIFLRKKLCVNKISNTVAIGLRTNDRLETSRPCSHLYESVQDVDVTPSDEHDATYVNSNMISRESGSSLHISHYDYVTPNDVKRQLQTDDKDCISGVYISLHHYQ